MCDLAIRTEDVQDVRVHLEPELRHQADELFSEMGLSLSMACTIFVRQSLLEGGMPFDYMVFGSQPTKEDSDAADNLLGCIRPDASAQPVIR